MDMVNKIVSAAEYAANWLDEHIRWAWIVARGRARANREILVRGGVLDPDNHPSKNS